MTDMAQVGEIQIPHVRWGGRWAKDLSEFDGCDGGAWVEIAEYQRTTGYQVARALNLGASLPDPPEGKRFEFASRQESNGSILLVRCVDADDDE